MFYFFTHVRFARNFADAILKLSSLSNTSELTASAAAAGNIVVVVIVVVDDDNVVACYREGGTASVQQ